MLPQLLSAEQLGSKRRFSVMLCLPKTFAQACPNLKQISMSLSAIQRIISFLTMLLRVCGPAAVF